MEKDMKPLFIKQNVMLIREHLNKSLPVDVVKKSNARKAANFYGKHKKASGSDINWTFNI